jgi:hypothetical protein
MPFPHKLTKAEQAKGGHVRAERMSAEQRGLSAAYAVTARWHHPRKGGLLAEVEGLCRAARALTVKGQEIGDDKLVATGVKQMVQLERMKIRILRQPPPPIDVDASFGDDRRLGEAEPRWNRGD